MPSLNSLKRQRKNAINRRYYNSLKIMQLNHVLDRLSKLAHATVGPEFISRIRQYESRYDAINDCLKDLHIQIEQKEKEIKSELNKTSRNQ